MPCVLKKSLLNSFKKSVGVSLVHEKLYVRIESVPNYEKQRPEAEVLM